VIDRLGVRLRSFGRDVATDAPAGGDDVAQRGCLGAEVSPGFSVIGHQGACEFDDVLAVFGGLGHPDSAFRHVGVGAGVRNREVVADSEFIPLCQVDGVLHAVSGGVDVVCPVVGGPGELVADVVGGLPDHAPIGIPGRAGGVGAITGLSADVKNCPRADMEMPGSGQ